MNIYISLLACVHTHCCCMHTKKNHEQHPSGLAEEVGWRDGPRLDL